MCAAAWKFKENNMQKLKYGDTLSNVEIIDIAEGGKCVGKSDNTVVFVKNTVPGDVVDISIIKTKRRYYEGVITQFLSFSPHRTEAKCLHFGVCGGCKWQHLKYEEQLKFKQKLVKDNFERIAKVDVQNMEAIIPSESIYYYRNKLEFTFSDKRWLTNDEFKNTSENNHELRGLGFHIPGQYNKVLNVDSCYLQASPSNQIRLAVKEYTVANNYSYYNIKEQTGLMRNLIVRTSNQNEVMVIVVFGQNEKEKIDALLNHISDVIPQITALMYVVNTKANDTISDLDVVLYKGKDYITEKMDNIIYKVGPKSFFQTNSEQAYTLYKTVKELAALKGNETVYDLYTGTGSIAIFVAPYAKKVIGIDYIEQAIENANENSRLNGLDNTMFTWGIIEKVLDDAFAVKHGQPDVVITDPPRSGMHPNVITQILKLAPQKIVYISCNPSTQARDVALLNESYEVSLIQPVDMFPHTEHVENVVLLLRK